MSTRAPIWLAAVAALLGGCGLISPLDVAGVDAGAPIRGVDGGTGMDAGARDAGAGVVGDASCGDAAAMDIDACRCDEDLEELCDLGNGDSACVLRDQVVVVDDDANRCGWRWTTIEAGEDYTCAAVTNGGVYCWGTSAPGHDVSLPLTPGSLAFEVLPPGSVGPSVVLAGDQRAEDGAAPTRAMCALYGGALTCWGEIPGVLTGDAPPTPVRAPAGMFEDAGFEDVTVGYDALCAITDTGRVLCAGFNDDLQVGPLMVDVASSELTLRAGPSGDPTADAVSLGGGAFGCATWADEEVGCWGRNTDGQVGNLDGTPWALVERVTRVGLPGRPSAIDTGITHGCALFDTTVGCWGASERMTGVTYPRTDPAAVNAVAIDGASSAVALAVGSLHACIITGDRAIQCFGVGEAGQRGGIADPANPEPEIVPGLPPDAMGITAGDTHTCALFGVEGAFASAAHCWGQPDGQRLGVDVADVTTIGQIVEVPPIPVQADGSGSVSTLPPS